MSVQIGDVVRAADGNIVRVDKHVEHEHLKGHFGYTCKTIRGGEIFYFLNVYDVVDPLQAEILKANGLFDKKEGLSR